MFEKIGQPYSAVELNRRDDGAEIQSVLHEMTGARTVRKIISMFCQFTMFRYISNLSFVVCFTVYLMFNMDVVPNNPCIVYTSNFILYLYHSLGETSKFKGWQLQDFAKLCKPWQQ